MASKRMVASVHMPLVGKFGLDMSALLDPPAGKHGFLKARDDGHFYFENGTQGRFWGLNLFGGTGCFLPHEQAEGIADHLASIGCNMVRFHAFDIEAEYSMLDYTYGDSRHIHPQRMDEMEYMIHLLKERGIYTYMDLLDYRRWKPGDGLPETEQINWAGKPACMVNARMVELQKEYATQLLTHRNPYTGLRWVDDPAIAVVETTNENTLFWQQWRDLSPYYRDELNGLWNEWLLQRYGGREELRRAWTNHRGECALLPDEDPANRTVRMPDVLRAWNGLSARERAYSDPISSPARCNDATLLFYEWERAYHATMRQALRSLGVKAPLSACVTNHVPPDLRAVAEELDFISAGMYYDHPDWTTRGIVGKEWNVEEDQLGYINDDPELRSVRINSAIPWPALSKVAGKPLIIREWNLPWPNSYRSEAMLQMAAYACLQDWDGLLFFGMGGQLRPARDTLDPFTCFNDPERWTLFPLAAQMFLRRDVKTSEAVLEVGHSAVDTHYACTAWQDDPTRISAYVLRTQKRFYDDRYDGHADIVANTGASATGDYTGATHAYLRAENGALDLHDHEIDRTALAARHQGGLRFANRATRDLHIRVDFDNPWVAFQGMGFDGHQFMRSLEPGMQVGSLPKGAEPVGTAGELCLGYVDGRYLMIPGLFTIEQGGWGRRDWMLTGRLLLDALRRWGLADVSHGDLDEGRIRSSTGELCRDFERGVLTIDTDRFQAALGFVGGQEIATRNLAVQMVDEHCVVALSSLDDRPIAESSHLLLATVGRASNTGQTVRRHFMTDIGRAPVLYTPPAGRVTIAVGRSPRSVAVRACDPTGAFLYEAAAQVNDRRLVLELEPQGPVALYDLRVS